MPALASLLLLLSIVSRATATVCPCYVNYYLATATCSGNPIISQPPTSTTTGACSSLASIAMYVKVTSCDPVGGSWTSSFYAANACLFGPVSQTFQSGVCGSLSVGGQSVSAIGSCAPIPSPSPFGSGSPSPSPLSSASPSVSETSDSPSPSPVSISPVASDSGSPSPGASQSGSLSPGASQSGSPSPSRSGSTSPASRSPSPVSPSPSEASSSSSNSPTASASLSPSSSPSISPTTGYCAAQEEGLRTNQTVGQVRACLNSFTVEVLRNYSCAREAGCRHYRCAARIPDVVLAQMSPAC